MAQMELNVHVEPVPKGCTVCVVSASARAIRTMMDQLKFLPLPLATLPGPVHFLVTSVGERPGCLQEGEAPAPRPDLSRVACTGRGLDEVAGVSFNLDFRLLKEVSPRPPSSTQPALPGCTVDCRRL